MIDEHFHRNYQAGRAELNAGLAALFDGIAHTLSDSFRALHRIQWNAPWNPTVRARRPN